MTTYVDTNPGDIVQLHDVLRVSFSEVTQWFRPDSVTSQALQDDINRMVDTIDTGGYPVVPVSDITVAPNATAITIDFMPPGAGQVSVAEALQALMSAARGTLQPFDTLVIDRVQRIPAAQAGAPGAGAERGAVSQTIEQQLEQTALGATLARYFGTAVTGITVVGGVVLLVIFAPQIKAVLNRTTK